MLIDADAAHIRVVLAHTAPEARGDLHQTGARRLRCASDLRCANRSKFFVSNHIAIFRCAPRLSPRRSASVYIQPPSRRAPLAATPTTNSSQQRRCSIASARDLAKESVVHAMTNVTGFSLLGHALEMARGAGKTIAIKAKKLPLLKEAVAPIAKRIYHRRLGPKLEELRRERCASRGHAGMAAAAFSRSANFRRSSGRLRGRTRRCALKTIASAGFPAARVIGEVKDGEPRVGRSVVAMKAAADPVTITMSVVDPIDRAPVLIAV